MKNEVNCRNLKCPSNTKGECCHETIHFVPVGPHTDRLICVEAPRAEGETKEVTMVDGVAKRTEGTDPSSK